MERNEIATRIVSELQKEPMLTAKELCRAIHGKNEKTLRHVINSILHKNPLKFEKHSPASGKKAPRWTSNGTSTRTDGPLESNQKICKFCTQPILDGEEFRHVRGACKIFKI